MYWREGLGGGAMMWHHSSLGCDLASKALLVSNLLQHARAQTWGENNARGRRLGKTVGWAE